MTHLNLSARAYHRILKRARMIADLAGCEEIGPVHLAEALHASQPPKVEDGIKPKIDLNKRPENICTLRSSALLGARQPLWFCIDRTIQCF